jgi:hypothetical protein
VVPTGAHLLTLTDVKLFDPQFESPDKLKGKVTALAKAAAHVTPPGGIGTVISNE